MDVLPRPTGDMSHPGCDNKAPTRSVGAVSCCGVVVRPSEACERRQVCNTTNRKKQSIKHKNIKTSRKNKPRQHLKKIQKKTSKKSKTWKNQDMKKKSIACSSAVFSLRPWAPECRHASVSRVMKSRRRCRQACFACLSSFPRIESCLRQSGSTCGETFLLRVRANGCDRKSWPTPKHAIVKDLIMANYCIQRHPNCQINLEK